MARTFHAQYARRCRARHQKSRANGRQNGAAGSATQRQATGTGKNQGWNADSWAPLRKRPEGAATASCHLPVPGSYEFAEPDGKAMIVPCATAHSFSLPSLMTNTSQRQTAWDFPVWTA